MAPLASCEARGVSSGRDGLATSKSIPPIKAPDATRKAPVIKCRGGGAAASTITPS
ncbi:hypothetical protein AZKH_p0579 (plasmid) [Azoarcus sp. KH32C]|nr:hypothetical protein AZKH_p0579 [Azoarcus sp. KH32C]